MYAGHIVEEARVRDLYHDSRHPYTIGLLQSLPRLDETPGTKLLSIPGHPPDQISLPAGCPFAPRCRYTEPHCLEENPSLELIADDHQVACWESKHIKLEENHASS